MPIEIITKRACPIMDRVISKPEEIVLKFAWTIEKFRDMSENWFDLCSKGYDLFPGCCTVKFKIHGPYTGSVLDDGEFWDSGLADIDPEDLRDPEYINTTDYYTVSPQFNCSQKNPEMERRELVSHLMQRHGVAALLWHSYIIHQGERIHQRRTRNVYEIDWSVKKEIIDAYPDIKDNNGSFEFRAELKMTRINQDRLENLALKASLNLDPGRLAIDFGDLLKSKDYCDFTIKTKDGCLEVHKAVLAARSPVLKALLNADMRERSENILNLDYVGSQSVKKFIEFIYTDELEFEVAKSAEGGTNTETEKNKFQLAVELLRLAEQYDLARLRGLCKIELNGSMSAESVFEILRLTDLHGIESLRSSALKFIKFHRSSLADSEHLNAALDHSPKLRKDIIAALANK